jgi:hypothetical protein
METEAICEGNLKVVDHIGSTFNLALSRLLQNDAAGQNVVSQILLPLSGFRFTCKGVK